MLTNFKSSWICEMSTGFKKVHKVEKKFPGSVDSNKGHVFPKPLWNSKSLQIWKIIIDLVFVNLVKFHGFENYFANLWNFNRFFLESSSWI